MYKIKININKNKIDFQCITEIKNVLKDIKSIKECILSLFKFSNNELRGGYRI